MDNQGQPSFDLPRPEPLPFAPVGPLRRPDEVADATLPFDPPSDRRMVFATMGTLQGGRMRLWRPLARACRRAGVALVIATPTSERTTVPVRLRGPGSGVG